jgi:Helix-turn-helix domain
MFEIGNSLREARVRQGLDYPQVELATKIRAKYIRALEEEHFEVLPSGTYIKGFMRSYAEFLGLDGQLYVDEYNSRHVVEGFDDMPQRRPRVHQDRSIERKVVLLTLAGIAAVTALVIVAWKFGGSGSPASTPPVVSTHKPAAKPGLRFTARGNGAYVRVWTKPWVGKPYVEETLQAGNKGFVPGKRFWVFVKHPAHIRFTLAGKPVTVYAGRNIVTSTKTTRVTG